MTDVEKLAVLKSMLDESDTTSDEVANAYLKAAENIYVYYWYCRWHRLR